MFVASSAMESFGNSIEVVGNNISNSNTVGFKTSRVQFADLLPSINGDLEIGRGTRLTDVSKPFQQGGLETTPNDTDLALEGNGFFVVKDPASGTSYYTRAGEFHLDSTGKLVDPSGFVLQGTAGDLDLGGATTVAAKATSTMAFQMNLDASAVTPASSFPASSDASKSAWFSASNFAAVQTIYDSDGTTHDLTFLFRKTAPNTWEYRVVAQRNELDPSAPNSSELREVATPGSLVFTSDGQLDTGLSNVTDISGLTWNGGAAQSISGGSVDFAGTIQYGQPSVVSASSQDGFAEGSLAGFTIDSQGVVTARYTNNTTTELGTIALANFFNVDDLDPHGDTLFLPTLESGAATIGVPDQDGFGSIVSGALEMSTVDLAEQFVALISTQRAFQVNSRIITTADQMYAEAVNLKP
jgi:flagellar hook protein FlgE